MTTLIAFVIAGAVCLSFGLALVRIQRLREERDQWRDLAHDWERQGMAVLAHNRTLQAELKQAREFNKVHYGN